jgi:malectin (di-glucose binding ER protein)
MQKKLVYLMIWIFLLGAASADAQTAIRVNAAGPAYTDSKGQAWGADFGFNNGNISACAPNSTVTGTSDPFLFKSARYGGTITPELQYTFAVPNGSYTVNLYFAETCPYIGAGTRVFDVQLQGATVFSALDIAKIAGANHALIKSAAVSVNSKQLTIRFVHHIQNPILSAIEIVPATTATAPAISSQPASTAVIAGQAATFSVTATGSARLTYQWQRGGVAISGATSSAYTTAATTTSDNGAQFRVVVANSKGTTTSSAATLTVNPTAVAPTVSSQPANQTVTAGQTATFSVTASGTAPLSYQWQRGGVAISGATSAAYTTAATTSFDNGAQFRAIGFQFQRRRDQQRRDVDRE